MTTILRRLAVLAALLAPPFALPAAAAPVDAGNVTADLVSAAARAAPGGTVRVALRQTIRPGWHTYWRNPGDSGLPTTIAWTLPEGVRASAIRWPYPGRVPYGPLVNYGYKNEAWLLADLAVPKDWPAGRPLEVRARADWLVCADVCVPEGADLVLTVPTGPTAAPDPGRADAFARAAARLPAPSPWKARFAATGGGEDGRLDLVLDAPGLDAGLLAGAAFFPFEPGAIANAADQEAGVAPDGLRLRLTPGAGPPAGRLAGVLVLDERLADGPATRAVVLDAAPDPTAADAAFGTPVGAGSGTWAADGIGGPVAAIGLAFLGGVLLNLMPCVFPVLAMKALGLVGHADARGRRRHGLAYTAGVLTSFAALGTALLVLRAGGGSVGWGFQLQNPAVVAALAYVLFAVGLNLTGAFELSGRLAGMGGRLAGRKGLAGAFGTGVLAAVVAAPCTAPFMAAAVGFALTQAAPVLLAVVMSLGLGLALPYLLLTLLPGLGRALPRPGAWMGRLRRLLALPMFASAAWLVWVLSRQTGPDGVLAALGGMVLIGLAAWALRLPGGRLRPAGVALAGAATLGALGLLRVPAEARPPVSVTATPAAGSSWRAYDPATLDRLRTEGRPVLIDATAAWCITCLVNERVALTGGAFEDALKAGNVAFLKADWTGRDPEVTALLERFGRAGVPLYVLYPAGGGEPRVLPQILTAGLVLDALADAAAPRRAVAARETNE